VLPLQQALKSSHQQDLTKPLHPKQNRHQEAASQLSRYEVLVLVDTRRPVAMFGYSGGPSQLITHLSDDAIWEIDDALLSGTIPQALALLAEEVGAGRVVPGRSCRGVFSAPLPVRPPVPPADGQFVMWEPGSGPCFLEGERVGWFSLYGRQGCLCTADRGQAVRAVRDPSTHPPNRAGCLTAAGMSQLIAALQPEGCVVVDESLTSGGAYWEASKVSTCDCWSIVRICLVVDLWGAWLEGACCL